MPNSVKAYVTNALKLLDNEQISIGNVAVAKCPQQSESYRNRGYVNCGFFAVKFASLLLQNSEIPSNMEFSKYNPRFTLLERKRSLFDSEIKELENFRNTNETLFAQSDAFIKNVRLIVINNSFKWAINDYIMTIRLNFIRSQCYSLLNTLKKHSDSFIGGIQQKQYEVKTQLHSIVRYKEFLRLLQQKKRNIKFSNTDISNSAHRIPEFITQLNHLNISFDLSRYIFKQSLLNTHETNLFVIRKQTKIIFNKEIALHSRISEIGKLLEKDCNDNYRNLIGTKLATLTFLLKQRLFKTTLGFTDSTSGNFMNHQTPSTSRISQNIPQITSNIEDNPSNLGKPFSDQEIQTILQTINQSLEQHNILNQMQEEDDLQKEDDRDFEFDEDENMER